MSAIGTLSWARSTGGRLSASERLALTATGLGSQVKQMSDKTAYALGLRKDRLARLDLDSVRLPDTPAAKEAEQIADEGFPPFMWHHSHRSYLWALALANLDSLKPDEEFLYIACLMHDAGMLGIGEREKDACFTVASADAAARCARAANGDWGDERRERLMEAITLHINPVVDTSAGVEASLLARGSTLDGVALRGAWRVDPETKRAVLARHPRHNIQKELPGALKAHGKEAPKCRIAFFLRYGALAQLVRHSPFDE
ncbi:MAG TPA: hypothetical protein VHF45_12965 [Thermoleophilaceae bacterium]|nr:hypothetical protein [Thermoleophilaceae bacterium]